MSLVSAREEAERISELDLQANPAYFDLVTGLPNRRLFVDRLAMAMANARRDNGKVALMDRKLLDIA